MQRCTGQVRADTPSDCARRPRLGAWASVTPAGPIRDRAYSVDAVAEQLTFTTGPVTIAVIIAAASPLAGLLVTAAVVLTGTIGMTSGPVSAKQKGAPHRLASEDKPLRQKGFIPNLIILRGVGIVLGAIEVAVPASADRGTPSPSPAGSFPCSPQAAPSAGSSTANSPGA